jgi:uncharacterized phiE125 gp8 family phage protein
MYSLTIVAQPMIEPLTLAEVKTHLAVDHDDEDVWVTAAIKGARVATELYTGRRWLSQTLRLTLADWPDCLDVNDVSYDPLGYVRLPVEPVQSVSSVEYLDEDKVLTTIDSSDIDSWLDHSPPLICPDPDSDGWPEVGSYLGAVRVEFIAGYASAEQVPASVKTAMLLTIGHWYENRGDQSPSQSSGLPPAARFQLDLLWTGSYR